MRSWRGTRDRTGNEANSPGLAEQLERRPLADSASLLVVFYGDRAKPAIRELHLTLYRELANDPEATSVPSNPWRTRDGNVGLRLDEPAAIAGHDTMVVRLAFNEPGEAVLAWGEIERRLAPLEAELPKKDIWGQSLIYQAALPPNADADAALQTVLPALHRFPPAPLAQTDIKGGRLWLLAAPLRGTGLAASTVYAALVPREQERAFVPAILWGPAAWLLLPDSIATKGYFLRREHLGVDPEGYTRDDSYRNTVRMLREVTAHLLDDLGKRIADTDEVDDLAKAYGPVAEAVPLLKRLHISLLQQVHNFGREQERLGDNPIFTFHRQQLETAAYELELKVVDGQAALDAARGAGDLAQVRIDREQEQRQYRTQTMLALVSAVLAVSQVVDKTVAAAFLRLLGVNAPTGDTTVVGALLDVLGVTAPPADYSVWWLVGVQVGAILLIALLVVGVSRRLARRRRH